MGIQVGAPHASTVSALRVVLELKVRHADDPQSKDKVWEAQYSRTPRRVRLDPPPQRSPALRPHIHSGSASARAAPI